MKDRKQNDKMKYKHKLWIIPDNIKLVIQTVTDKTNLIENNAVWWRIEIFWGVPHKNISAAWFTFWDIVAFFFLPGVNT